MLTRAQEQLIASLKTKKGREESGYCLVEGKKVIATAGKAVQWTFSAADTKKFDQLVDVQTPQGLAGVARIPEWSERDVFGRNTVIVLDGVQDPGNVGAIARLCLGFGASLILVESADITAPKVIRASVGALFSIPWIRYSRAGIVQIVGTHEHTIYRLEKTNQKNKLELPAERDKLSKKAIIIAGSEGHGIELPITGTSVSIRHEKTLESLNVGHALAILLSLRYSSQ